MKIGDKVKTIHGTGIIIGFDLPESDRTKRAIVDLENNPFGFMPCYFKKEIEVLK